MSGVSTKIDAAVVVLFWMPHRHRGELFAKASAAVESDATVTGTAAAATTGAAPGSSF